MRTAAPTTLRADGRLGVAAMAAPGLREAEPQSRHSLSGKTPGLCLLFLCDALRVYEAHALMQCAHLRGLLAARKCALKANHLQFVEINGCQIKMRCAEGHTA